MMDKFRMQIAIGRYLSFGPPAATLLVYGGFPLLILLLTYNDKNVYDTFAESRVSSEAGRTEFKIQSATNRVHLYEQIYSLQVSTKQKYAQILLNSNQVTAHTIFLIDKSVSYSEHQLGEYFKNSGLTNITVVSNAPMVFSASLKNQDVQLLANLCLMRLERVGQMLQLLTCFENTKIEGEKQKLVGLNLRLEEFRKAESSRRHYKLGVIAVSGAAVLWGALKWLWAFRLRKQSTAS